jgi:hypothetical protein
VRGKIFCIVSKITFTVIAFEGDLNGWILIFVVY